MTPAVTVFVPGLQAGGGWPASWPGALTRMLSPGDGPLAGEGWAPRLLQLFDLPADAGLAALARLGERRAHDARWWARCDPVHLAPDGDRLLLADNETLTLDAAAAERLSAPVAALFQEEGGTLEVLAANRWYLTLPAPEPLSADAPTTLAGRDIHPHLPSGNTRYWRRRLNEAQMVLAPMADVETEASGLAVNSVWFWGAGYAPAARSGPFAEVYSDDVVVGGAACTTGARWEPLPAGPADLGAHGDALIVLRGAQAPAQYGDVTAWEGFLEAMVATWLGPLAQRLRRGDLRAVVVLGERGPTYRLRPARRFRLWRS